MSAGLSLTANDAKGTDREYMRYQGNVMFMAPAKDNASWNVGLTAYQLDYPKSSTNRKDFFINLSTGYTKPVKEWFSWGVTGAYTNNTSNSNSNDYSKYTVLANAIFNYSM